MAGIVAGLPEQNNWMLTNTKQTAIKSNKIYPHCYIAMPTTVQAYLSRCDLGCVCFVLLIVSPHCEQEKINTTWFITGWIRLYRGLLYSAQNIVKKDSGRVRQNSVNTAGTNFTKPGAQHKVVQK